MTMTAAAAPVTTNTTPAQSSHTSEDLSYDRESQTNDPFPQTTSATTPSVQPNPTSITNHEPKPTISTSSTVLPTTFPTHSSLKQPTVDPIILQLQQFLHMMSTHINTIEESTAQQFTLMQDQFTSSQMTIANILKEGLQDMQTQRLADRDALANIRATLPPSNNSTPTPPPGSVHVPVSSNRSFTSSLGNPPASGYQETTVSRPKPTKQDPPECFCPIAHSKRPSSVKPKPNKSSDPIKTWDFPSPCSSMVCKTTQTMFASITNIEYIRFSKRYQIHTDSRVC
jgi:hypothetical protein